jgi:hypothetical protein
MMQAECEDPFVNDLNRLVVREWGDEGHGHAGVERIRGAGGVILIDRLGA